MGGSLTAAAIRLSALGWDLGFMIPELVFDVEVTQSLEGSGEALHLETFLPLSDTRQSVISESNAPEDLTLSTTLESGNRVARWEGSPTGPRTVRTSYRVRTAAVRYELPEEIPLGEPSRGETEDLEPTKVIQSTSPEITALAAKLLPPSGALRDYLRAVFDKVSSLGMKPFKGTTDALTALRLGEASCNGRSRLMVALLRARGIAARLVGGVVLDAGDKKTSHQWLEARVGGHWVPFDPTNGQFAALPQHYLALYRGDEVLFRHSRDIGFKYLFSIRPNTAPRQEVHTHKAELGLWRVFERMGIPPDLLKVIVLIPVGAVVVVLFRNVIGFRTFGSFLPVLIAASMRHTGFWWGAAGFVAILLVVALVRRLMSRLELLHSPQLAVLLTLVIALMLGLATIAADHDLPDLARISLFPFAILAITSERFAIMIDEEGYRPAMETLLRTLVVVFFCHYTMTSLSLQILMLGFPELLAVVAAIDIWLGRWVGLRMTEWLRFRPTMAVAARRAS